MATTTVLSEQDVLEIVEKKLGKPEKVNSFEIKPFSETPSGFLGTHLCLKVNIGNNETLQFFAKQKPFNSPGHLKYAEGTGAFYKEIEFYKTLFKDLQKVQNPDIKWCPDYYFSKGHDLIVFEDLRLNGYELYPDRKLLDEDHMKASFKVIAKMHAASFVFEDRYRKGLVDTVSKSISPKERELMELKDIYPNLIFESEQSDIIGHVGHTFCEVGIKAAQVLLDYIDGYTEEEMEIVRRRLPDEMRKMYQMVKPSQKYKNIFLHGDLWTNNVLFKYNEDGSVQDALLIDFQMLRFGPPALDLTMFFYLTQNQEFRMKKQDELWKYYHNQLGQELKKYQLDVEKLHSWAEFQESLLLYNKYAALTTVMNFQLAVMPQPLVDRLFASPEYYEKTWYEDRSDLVKEGFFFDENGKKRMIEAYHEVIRSYILETNEHK